jgi:hypothetical protein
VRTGVTPEMPAASIYVELLELADPDRFRLSKKFAYLRVPSSW